MLVGVTGPVLSLRTSGGPGIDASSVLTVSGLRLLCGWRVKDAVGIPSLPSSASLKGTASNDKGPVVSPGSDKRRLRFLLLLRRRLDLL